jgi:hypothetical protein
VVTLDSRSVSRWVAAVGLLAAPILFTVADLVEPAWSDDSAEYLGEVASGTTGHLLWGLLWAIGGVCLLAGMIGVARLLRGGRGGAVGVVGAWMVGVSAAVVGGVMAALAVVEVAMVDAAADRAEMVALYDRTEEVWLALAIFGTLFFGGFGLGTLLVAAGLAVRRPVPLWSPLLLVAWLAVTFVSPSQLVNTLSVVLLLGAFAPVAYRIASMSNEVWERWQPLPAREPRATPAAATLRTTES